MTKSKASSSFDPAAHLAKQGWKGKGTALKHGHAVRPLPVVQKKSLTGIGKDRDAAVPFWDHIFASTALSLSLPSSISPSPSGSPAPPALPSHVDHTTTKAWATLAPHGSPAVPPKKPGAGLSIAVRAGKEVAKRGLYSRFFRGEVLSWEPSPEPEEEDGEVEDRMAGEVSGVESRKGKGKGKDKARDGETKEERRARKAEKAARKADKEVRRAEKEARRAIKRATKAREAVQPPEATSLSAGARSGAVDPSVEVDKKKKSKRKHDGEGHLVTAEQETARAKSKKRQRDAGGDAAAEVELKDKKSKKSKGSKG
ncbi:hypothetical protein JCM24511_08273 [Saitozyma sp. JCM 24511]|nr:hypothetical protein JCM24511_08273 [Saitozyma sp. JCM 24511]